MKARKNNCDKSTFLSNRFDDSELIFNMYCDEYYRWLRARVKRWVLYILYHYLTRLAAQIFYKTNSLLY
jgi:hypothetical protein